MAEALDVDANEILNVEGDHGPIRWSFKNDSCVVRVDVPGCSGVPDPENILYYHLQESHATFAIDEPAMDQTDQLRRRYNGYVKFDPAVYDGSKAAVKVVNGVLWITVPMRHVV